MGCHPWHGAVACRCLWHDLGLVKSWPSTASSNATVSWKVRIRLRWHAHHQLDRCVMEFATTFCAHHIFPRHAGVLESGTAGVGRPKPIRIWNFESAQLVSAVH